MCGSLTADKGDSGAVGVEPNTVSGAIGRNAGEEEINALDIDPTIPNAAGSLCNATDDLMLGITAARCCKCKKFAQVSFAFCILH